MSKYIETGMLNGVTIGGLPVNTSKPCHCSNYANLSGRTVDYIVMHFTGNSKDTAWANANYFQGANRQASAHFFVDDGNIYQTVELRDRAWHAGGEAYYHSYCRNQNAFGIEMCTSGNYHVSEKTKENAAQLCAHLCKLIGISADKVDTYVLRHYDITHKSCPAQMAGSNNAEWAAFKKRVKAILDGTEVVKSDAFLVKLTQTVPVRKTASKEAGRIDTEMKGDYFTVVEISKGGNWYRRKLGGWVPAKYCEKVKK